MEKSKDLEKKPLEILIPKTSLNPGQHRALIISMGVGEEIRTDSGLIVPDLTMVKDKNQNNVRIEARRYYVVKASKDFMVDTAQPKVKMEMGDELYPLIWDGVTPINLPIITDWDNKGIQMNVIHDSEVFGWKKKDPTKFSEVTFCSCPIPDYIKVPIIGNDSFGVKEKWICQKCGNERR